MSENAARAARVAASPLPASLWDRFEVRQAGFFGSAVLEIYAPKFLTGAAHWQKPPTGSPFPFFLKKQDLLILLVKTVLLGADFPHK